MSYKGDYLLGSTVYIWFTSRNTTPVPTTLSGSPAVAIYKNTSTTESTTGVTLTVDFDSRTGLNFVQIVATSGNGFAVGDICAAVITSGTVGGNSVVGEVIGTFTIEKATAGVTTAGLSSIVTSIIAFNPSGFSSLAIDGSGRVTIGSIAAGAITATAIAADAIGASELAADAVAEIADGVWDELRSGHTVTGSYGESNFAIVNGAAATGTLSTTQMTTNLTEATTGHYIGRTIVWVSGALTGQASNVTAYDGSTKMLTYSTTTDAPSNGDRFVLV